MSDKPVISYPPEAVLGIEHVAAWMRVGPRTIEREDYPFFFVGTRKRFLAKKILEHIEKKHNNGWTVTRGKSA